MSEPVVFDVRAGLTQEVLDGLRRAERVTMAAKDMRTAVLGYWSDDQLTIVLIDSDPLFNFTQIPRAAPGLEGREIRPVIRGTPRLRGLVADLRADDAN